MRLTKAQNRALSKLTNEWKSAFDLKESVHTLISLKNSCYADVRYARFHIAFPRTSIYFKLSKNKLLA